jgi:hypothetical protein
MALAVVGLAAAPPEYKRSGSNKALEMSARLIEDREEAKRLLGVPAGAGLVLVEVQANSIEDTEVDIHPDDFTLVSARDGQKSQPFAPEQLASTAVIVVNRKSAAGPAVATQPQGPVMGPGGPTLPGTRSGIGGGGASGPGEVSATVQTGRPGRDPALEQLLKALKENELPPRVTAKGIRGLLVFGLEGKYRPRDLTVIYRGREGRITMDFSGK